jgi:hypothetical protein
MHSQVPLQVFKSAQQRRVGRKIPGIVERYTVAGVAGITMMDSYTRSMINEVEVGGGAGWKLETDGGTGIGA